MPLAAPERPRKILPPPITRQSSTPVATISLMSSATCVRPCPCRCRTRVAHQHLARNLQQDRRSGGMDAGGIRPTGRGQLRNRCATSDRRCGREPRDARSPPHSVRSSLAARHRGDFGGEVVRLLLDAFAKGEAHEARDSAARRLLGDSRPLLRRVCSGSCTKTCSSSTTSSWNLRSGPRPSSRSCRRACPRRGPARSAPRARARSPPGRGRRVSATAGGGGHVHGDLAAEVGQLGLVAFAFDRHQHADLAETRRDWLCT